MDNTHQVKNRPVKKLEPDGTEVELGLTFRIIMQQMC